jgi:cation diffusion facilitator family transporter
MSHSGASGGGSAGTREGSLRMALVFCLIDLALMGSAAWNSNSVTILGDLLKEATDTLAVLAAFMTVRAVRRSPGYRFAYGIGKIENLVSVSIGVVMIVCALTVTVRSAHQLRYPEMARGTLPGIAVFALYAAIGFYISLRARRIANRQPSAIMESQAKLWFSKGAFDAAMGFGLLIALFFQDYEWSWYLDPLASLVGVVFMIHAAWAMTTSSVGDLLDATVSEETQIRIMRELVHHIDDYERIHKIRTRRSGPHMYSEIFLEFDPNILMGEAQRRIDSIRADLESQIPGLDVAIRPTVQPVD